MTSLYVHQALGVDPSQLCGRVCACKERIHALIIYKLRLPNSDLTGLDPDGGSPNLTSPIPFFATSYWVGWANLQNSNVQKHTFATLARVNVNTAQFNWKLKEYASIKCDNDDDDVEKGGWWRSEHYLHSHFT
jgi:hypothetical protein